MDRETINCLPESGASATKEVAIRIALRNAAYKAEKVRDYLREFVFGNMDLPED